MTEGGSTLTSLILIHKHFSPCYTTVTVCSRRSGRAAISQPLRALDSDWLTTVASPIPSSTLVADYFSTVDEIAAGIGNTPWLQFFIPTAVGMSIALAIVFSLYITAQPYEPPSK